MSWLRSAGRAVSTVAFVLFAASPLWAQEARPSSSARVTDFVNQRMVKVFGMGGIRGINAYGSGVIVSADGYVLTTNTPMLDTPDLIVHLWDGRRLSAKVVVTEPELDAALLKIDKVEDLPYFDVVKAGKAPPAQPGDLILAFSNLFEIATRDEPMSVQHGVIAAYSKLHGRRGVFEAPYSGDVYVIDAITNNPGAGGGAVTSRKGEMLGIIGKEVRNSLSDTWINYAVPIPVLADFVDKGIKGTYKPFVKVKPAAGPSGFHGIILVPNVVERTPPFVEDTLSGSPAAKAGLRPDDLIVYVNNEKIVSIKEFHDLVDKTRPGTEVKLEVRRGERLITVMVKLEEMPKRAASKKP
ncbi:MAG TPA: trypsin-like peptidase domain-containing protein [Gemmataceae bacterium]|nr:trypsin-like peptidase domain-containing protein [Gemmataceae bacterium]